MTTLWLFRISRGNLFRRNGPERAMARSPKVLKLGLTISTVFYLYIGLNRDNLVAFAVLVGCDYLPQGVQGVGKKKAMELISTVNHSSLLDR